MTGVNTLKYEPLLPSTFVVTSKSITAVERNQYDVLFNLYFTHDIVMINGDQDITNYELRATSRNVSVTLEEDIEPGNVTAIGLRVVTSQRQIVVGVEVR